MALAGTAALNWHWSWQQINETPMAVLLLMWRQTAMAAQQNIGITLSEKESLAEIKRNLNHGTQRIFKT